jgi:hypothetical protein
LGGGSKQLDYFGVIQAPAQYPVAQILQKGERCSTSAPRYLRREDYG